MSDNLYRRRLSKRSDTTGRDVTRDMAKELIHLQHNNYLSGLASVDSTSIICRSSLFFSDNLSFIGVDNTLRSYYPVPLKT